MYDFDVDSNYYIKGTDDQGNTIYIVLGSGQQDLFSVSDEGKIYNISSQPIDVLYVNGNDKSIIQCDQFSTLEVNSTELVLHDHKTNYTNLKNIDITYVSFCMIGVILLCLIFMKKSLH